MMNIPQLKPSRLTARLPSIALEPALKEAIESYAKAEKASVSAVVRHAVALFLQSDSRKSVQNTKLSEK
jgi:hypothetical protein